MDSPIIDIIYIASGIWEEIKPSKEYLEQSKKSYDVYCKLKEMLNGEALKLLNDFADLEMAAEAEACEDNFKVGVRTGARLMLDFLSDD